MLNDIYAKKIFKTLELFSKNKISDKLIELKYNQKLSETQINEIALNKLKKLIKHSIYYSPFYRKQYGHLDLSSFKNLSDIKQLNLLSKEELRYNVKSIVSSRPVSLLNIAKTSGSTGIPLLFPKDVLSSSYHYAAMYRGHSWYGLNIGDREARLWGVPVDFKNRTKVIVKDYLLNRFREKEYNLSENVLYDFYCKINKYHPKYIMGYGKMLTEFGLYLKQNNKNLEHLNLKMAKFTSENMGLDGINVVQETFCCPVVSEYGSAETGIIAFQCPNGSNHIMSDCVHIEYLDVDGSDNCFKEIVVTDLNNLSFPIIRYRIGDLVSPTNKYCSCGLPFPIINKIQGRVSESFTVNGQKKFHSIIFYYIMKGISEKNTNLKQFRVIQKSENIFSYQLVGDSVGNVIEKYIINKTKDVLGDDIIVEIKYVDYLPREKSGKFRDFIPYKRQY
ncbi:MAG: hypothetical protein KKG99_06415 [Bacteroidetes bacterium]|nr:hypothetical protein [Bacteroidota bacterium]